MRSAWSKSWYSIEMRSMRSSRAGSAPSRISYSEPSQSILSKSQRSPGQSRHRVGERDRGDAAAMPSGAAGGELEHHRFWHVLLEEYFAPRSRHRFLEHGDVRDAVDLQVAAQERGRVGRRLVRVQVSARGPTRRADAEVAEAGADVEDGPVGGDLISEEPLVDAIQHRLLDHPGVEQCPQQEPRPIAQGQLDRRAPSAQQPQEHERIARPESESGHGAEVVRQRGSEAASEHSVAASVGRALRRPPISFETLRRRSRRR